jgi:UDP-N-acetylmuramyl pentapeptide synthase
MHCRYAAGLDHEYLGTRSKSSMKAALDNFDKIDAKNKLVILGDMFELGETSDEEHQNIATTATQNKANQCIFVGACGLRFVGA